MRDYDKMKAEISRLHEVCRDYKEELPFETLQTYHHFLLYVRPEWVKECLTGTEYAELITHLTNKWEWYCRMAGDRASIKAVFDFVQYVFIRDKDMGAVFITYINKHHKNKW